MWEKVRNVKKVRCVRKSEKSVRKSEMCEEKVIEVWEKVRRVKNSGTCEKKVRNVKKVRCLKKVRKVWDKGRCVRKKWEKCEKK